MQSLWHKRGAPIAYLTEHPALALTEVLVHFEHKDDIPKSYKLPEINVENTRILQLTPDLRAKIK